MKRIIYFILAISLLSGCYEDKSSKVYDPIGSITIGDLEELYSVIAMVEPLTVTPTVTSTDPDDNPAEFEYRWIVYPSSMQSFETFKPHVLAEGMGIKNIADLEITLPPLLYTLQLRVTNPRNGYTVYATTKLNVNTKFTTGYYFLKETADGNTELDFMPLGEEVVQNLLENMTGEPIYGAPTRLGYIIKYSYMDDETGEFIYAPSLVPMGGKDLKIMKIEDMSMIYDHQTMFYGDPLDEKPLMCFNTSIGYPSYLSDKGLYLSRQAPEFGVEYYGTGKFGLPFEPSGGCSLSPNNVVFASNTSSTLNCFDEKNGRLIYYSSGDGSLLSMTTTSVDPEYNPNMINRTLLFMGTNGWAVFQDKANPQNRYLYELKLNTGRDPITSVKLIDPKFNFAKANVYGSNKRGSTTLLYAGVGDKLYMYDTAFKLENNPDGSPETQLYPKGISVGEEITMITHKPFAPSDYLVIATHKNGNYKVLMYTLSSGMPLDDPAIVAEGQGKVVDIQYAATKHNSSYNVNY